MPEAYAYAALLLFLSFARISTNAYDSVASEASNSSWGTPLPAPSTATCPSRTINYITHTLPQQCLKTSWTGGNTVTTAGAGSDPTAASHDVTILTRSLVSQTYDQDLRESAAAQSTHSVTATTTEATGTTVLSDQISSSSPQPSPKTSTYPLPIVPTESDSEGDSPLDNANFLSFEDWKNQNLAKAGQSVDNLANRRSGSEGQEMRRRPGNINNALDSLGEDSEIELDFGGFVTSGNAEGDMPSRGREAKDVRGTSGEDGERDQGNALSGAISRSKDAGKTCKERFNYASFDCAATVLNTNPQCKGSSSVLVENKDSYMLNECSAGNKFFIVELCGDILIDTVVLANFEFFSSMFRTFRVSVSDRYPVKLDKWKELGTFEARNSREVQPFLVENPLIWARYLRIEFLTHYGNEYYCPVSLLRVHGTTMMEEFRHQEEVSRGEEEEYEDDSLEIRSKGHGLVPEATAVGNSMKDAHEVEAEVTESAGNGSAGTTPSPSSPIVPSQDGTQGKSDQENDESASLKDLYNEEQPGSEALLLPFNASNIVCYAIERKVTLASGQSAEPTVIGAASSDEILSKPGSHPETHILSPSSVISPSAVGVSSDIGVSITTATSTFSSASVTEAKDQSSMSNALASTKTTDQTSQEASKTSSSVTSPPHPNPTTQENFFKSIHKRLQFLEANSTLSLQYIEDQSRILRDAFQKVEKRQLAKTTAFLKHLNTTVLTELRGFRQQYDQIWQSTVIELESQREQSHREVVDMSSRLSILADEVIFQKRMSIVQSTLILLCLGFVIFSRGAASSYLELPLVQSMVAKPHNTLRHPFESPSESPPSSRPNSSRHEGIRFGIFGGHRRDPSEDSTNDGTRSLIIEYSPPTPTSDAGHSDASSAGRRSPSPTPSE
ncbi:MAG: hypothetical protein M1830_003312, partial [Pleopsidium flavum]